MTDRTRAPRITGAQVARLAGVSPSTVSFVLNETSTQTIPESTRARVLDAARQLGYRPNPAARSLRVGRSDVVVALLPEPDASPAYQQATYELALALEPMGLSLVVHHAPGTSQGLVTLWRAVTPACVFSFTSLSPDDVAAMHAAGVQVTVGCSESVRRHPWELRFGGEELGQVQTEHLRDRGHTKVMLALPTSPVAAQLSAGRRAGIDAVLKTMGQPGAPTVEIPWDPALAEDHLAQALGAHPGVTAVIAWNDEVGAAVIAAAARLELAVPASLAVVGAYDFRLSTLTTPALTTVRVDLKARMTKIAEAIQAALGGAAPGEQGVTRDELQLVPRAST